jgi:seryl-tRNA synthetase
MIRVHEEFKMQFDKMRKESNESHKKLIEVVTAKKELENRYESEMAHLKNSIEVRQRELDELSSKMILPMDTDVLRIKMLKELEGPHRI